MFGASGEIVWLQGVRYFTLSQHFPCPTPGVLRPVLKDGCHMNDFFE